MDRPSPSFTCPCCWAVSYHPEDIAQGYCGACHDWTGDPATLARHGQGPCRARMQALLRADQSAALDDDLD